MIGRVTFGNDVDLRGLTAKQRRRVKRLQGKEERPGARSTIDDILALASSRNGVNSHKNGVRTRREATQRYCRN